MSTLQMVPVVSSRLDVTDPGLITFSTPSHTLVGRPAVRWDSARSDDAEWADRVLDGLGQDGLAVGAISFAPEDPAVMHRLSGGGFLATCDLSVPQPATLERRHDIAEVPSAHEYGQHVAELLEVIASGAAEKVVLGRFLDVRSHPPLDPGDLLARLLRTRPGQFVYSVPVPSAGRDVRVLGGSPELLVRRSGDRVEAMPLAGSIPRSADPAEDEQRREGLASSVKDLHEHRIVIEDLLTRLGATCDDVRADAPEVIGTDALWHLGTRVRARVRAGAGGTSVLHLAQLLHPTPAVGGAPRAEAMRLIGEHESAERGYLAGAVGWMDGRGDGEFALTLRSGVLDGENLRLFAGAGIVAGSDPAAEVRETGAKLRTMMSVVGL
ncbi:MAG: isochorismate synthase MenF [Nocardioides sp.]|uniref:isochorismate synthase n=1 Tax=Nocardioides sp. TaxID=35761 RepID=UPI003F021439